MSIHGIHHDAMTAQAQYAEWLRRLQAETRARISLQSEEVERERGAASDQSGEDAEEPKGEPESDESQSNSGAEDDGHLRSFA